MARKNIKNKTSSGKCPITFALDIFGDRWSLLILRDIIFKGKKHYGEFANSAEKISTNILASRLLKLETEGILTKTQDPDKLNKYVYGLTPKGEDLLPVLMAIIKWSAAYDEHRGDEANIIHGAPENLLERWDIDREKLRRELLEIR